MVLATVPKYRQLDTNKLHDGKYPGNKQCLAYNLSKNVYLVCRYINEVLDYARNNPQVINLLNIVEEVFQVKDIDNLVTRFVPKIKVSDKDIQTETHPIEEYIEKNYSWDLWEWKRRACQWASIVNCKTHSTQTDYSHLRAEIHCQTHELRDKCLQTKKDQGVNTLSSNMFLWGLRGQIGYGQHNMDLGERNTAEKKKAQVITVCSWPCVGSTDFTKHEENPAELDGDMWYAGSEMTLAD